MGKNCSPIRPSLFKNLSKVELWSQVKTILKNGKTGLTNLLYFILTHKTCRGSVHRSWFRDSLLRFILFLDCECLSRVMFFICLLYIVFPFYILLIILYISLIYHFLKKNSNHFKFIFQL